MTDFPVRLAFTLFQIPLNLNGFQLDFLFFRDFFVHLHYIFRMKTHIEISI